MRGTGAHLHPLPLPFPLFLRHWFTFNSLLLVYRLLCTLVLRELFEECFVCVMCIGIDLPLVPCRGSGPSYLHWTTSADEREHSHFRHLPNISHDTATAFYFYFYFLFNHFNYGREDGRDDVGRMAYPGWLIYIMHQYRPCSATYMACHLAGSRQCRPWPRTWPDAGHMSGHVSGSPDVRAACPAMAMAGRGRTFSPTTHLSPRSAQGTTPQPQKTSRSSECTLEPWGRTGTGTLAGLRI